MKNLICFGLFLTCLFFYTQDTENPNTNSLEEVERWEVNTSEIIFYNTTEKKSYWGTEVHVSYEVQEKVFLGSSFCFKYGLKDRKENDLAVLIGYEWKEWLCFNNGFNLTFINADRVKSTEASFYTEAEFNVLPYRNKVNIGPVLGATIGNSTEIYGAVHLEVKF